MNYVGVDPDSHTPALAVLDEQGRLIDIRVWKAPESIGAFDGVLWLCAEIGKSITVEEVQARADAEAVVAVESQENAYSARQGVTPRALIPVSQMAGALMIYCRTVLTVACAYLPPPGRWKGNVPKGVHQARTYAALGIRYEIRNPKSKTTCYAVPVGSDDPEVQAVLDAAQTAYGTGVWKHTGDAIGLALWAKKEWEDTMSRTARLAELNNLAKPVPKRKPRKKYGVPVTGRTKWA